MGGPTKEEAKLQLRKDLDNLLRAFLHQNIQDQHYKAAIAQTPPALLRAPSKRASVSLPRTAAIQSGNQPRLQAYSESYSHVAHAAGIASHDDSVSAMSANKGSRTEHADEDHVDAGMRAELGYVAMDVVPQGGSPVTAAHQPGLNASQDSGIRDQREAACKRAGQRRLRRVVKDRGHKTQHEQTQDEKDAIYEKVALRLTEIAAEVNGQQFAGGSGSSSTMDMLSLAVTSISSDVTYTVFSRWAGQWVSSVQLEVHQLALLYQLTGEAVRYLGTGSAQAQNVASYCVQYAFDHFAGVIVDKGGLESVIEDSDFELD